jgi:hypothetical protein
VGTVALAGVSMCLPSSGCFCMPSGFIAVAVCRWLAVAMEGCMSGVPAGTPDRQAWVSCSYCLHVWAGLCLMLLGIAK